MKAKDIKPGVVYGCRSSKYGPVEAVVFLTEPTREHLYARNRSGGAGFFVHQPTALKAERNHLYGVTGWPVATLAHQTSSPGRLADVTLEDFLKASSYHDTERGIRFDLHTVLGHIIGPYEEVIAAEEQERSALAAKQQEARNRDAAVLARAVDLIAGLSAHGVKAGRGDVAGETVLTLHLDEADKLLALLPTNTEET